MSPVEIDFNCPHCDHHIEKDESFCGQTIACPECGEDIIIPERQKKPAKIASINFRDESEAPLAEDDLEEFKLKTKPVFKAYYDRFFWAFILICILAPVLMLFNMHLFWAILLPLLIVGGITSLFVWIDTLTVDYSITNQRFFRRKGLISRQIDEIELFRIKDVQLSQNLMQRIFNCGTVVIYSSDDSTPTLSLDRIGDPMDVKEQIRQAFRDARKREGVQSAEFIPS